MRKNNDIEVLRAVGIIYVLLSHVGMFTPWNPSWVHFVQQYTYWWSGVDLFFCVSGFVIMRSLIKTIDYSNKENYLKGVISFWVRRFYRLVPASWFFLLLGILLSVVYNKTGIFGQTYANVNDALTQLFYLANWRLYSCSNGIGQCGMFAHYWSLSLEEQFYFLLPVAIFFLRKKVIYAFILLIVVQFAIPRPMSSWMWVTRIDAIMWGCLLAMLSVNNLYQLCKPNILKNRSIRYFVAFLLLASLAVFARGEVFSFGVGVIALVSATMVWISSYNEGLLFGRICNNRLVLWIGSRSYSIYLSHPIAFKLVMEVITNHHPLTGNDTFRVMFFGLIITFALSELSFRFIESPLRKKGKRIAEDISDK